MRNIPENSQIKADMVISMSTLSRKLNPGIDDQWGNYGASGYVLLKPGVNIKALRSQAPRLYGQAGRRPGEKEPNVRHALPGTPAKRVPAFHPGKG